MSTKKLAPGQVIEILSDSDVVKKAAGEHDARVLADRERLAASLVMLESDTDAALDRRRLALAESKTEFEAAQRKLNEAAAKHRALLASGSSISYGRDTRRAEIEAQLRATADPAIAAFIEEVRDRRHNAPNVMKIPPPTFEVNRLTGEKMERGISAEAYRELVNNHRIGCDEAIAAAQDLQLEPDQSVVPQRLAELRAGLPSQDVSLLPEIVVSTRAAFIRDAQA